MCHLYSVTLYENGTKWCKNLKKIGEKSVKTSIDYLKNSSKEYVSSVGRKIPEKKSLSGEESYIFLKSASLSA
jgi:hypothetical protein